ncbi:hypothetical protein [Thermococcus barophilus]|uniref:Uncharacterized protein n=1 Tax=Thermococcus barophilus TaxID=55802 RepID=A0A0S1XF98_THEBA|nr:hypothetical protein [Thermococcus barophilus]ALM76470.1 hypothetical protein TBCH5v1_2581 [Thermococcus barophilus]
MLKVLKRIVSNLDDFLFGVFGVIVGIAAYEYGVKPYILKRFLKK